MNCYSIPISIHRNHVWEANFSLYKNDGSPDDVSRDGIALVVFPTPPVSGSMPVIENTTPGVAVNVVSFSIPDETMKILVAEKPYTWQLLRAPSGTPGRTTVVVAGPLDVSDSPPYPV